MDANRMSGTLLGIAWVALAAAPLAGQTQAADAKPGVVEGAVINQLTGEPLRRAEVRLVPARALAGPAGAMGPGGGMGLGAVLGGGPEAGRGQMAAAGGGRGGGLGMLADHPVEHLYRAVRALRIYEGTTEIQHLIIARELLAARDYQIDDLEEQIPLGQVIERWLSSFRPVSLQELAVTSRQLALMVASGIAISRCLQFMANQPLSRQLSDAWKDIERRVHSGQSLSQAMRHYPHIFSEYYVGMIMAGESSGNFGECLDRISCCLEKEAVTRAKIRAALTYPSVIFALGGMITLAICHWLLPTLTASLFQGSNMVLPWPTKVLIMVTGFFQLPGMLPGVFICLGILGFLARQYFSTPAGKETLQSTMLQMPVLRKIQGKVLATHFCQTFSSLIRVGVPLTRCLQICSAVMGNVIVAKHILKIEGRVM